MLIKIKLLNIYVIPNIKFWKKKIKIFPIIRADMNLNNEKPTLRDILNKLNLVKIKIL